MTKRSIARDTCILSTIQLLLQGLGLLLNIFMTKRLGASVVGVISLVGSFYCLAAVLASGNCFLLSSRLISEEIGKQTGNPNRVLRYVCSFCMLLSLVVGAAIFVGAPQLATRVLKDEGTVFVIRLLVFTLPLSSLTACLKGYFHAYRNVLLPAAADTLEFLVRASGMAFCVAFLIPQGKCSIFFAIAISMLLGQLTAFLLLLFRYRRQRQPNAAPCTIRLRDFFAAAIPILCNSYLISILSSTNDALIPLTLRQYGHSMEVALCQFGIFEAILLPALFFPSVALSCLSCILVPELSRERAAKQGCAVEALVGTVLRQTIAFSAFVVLVLLVHGNSIGELIGGDAFAGRMLRVLAPVIPFIYLEIVLEGILRGLGKQNFSSANYLAEYLIRISVLLICAPIFGFYGIIASYYASNVVGNLVRLFMVLRLTAVSVEWREVLARPLFAVFLTWQLGNCVCRILLRLGMPGRAEPIAFALLGGICYLFLLRVLHTVHSPCCTCKDTKITTKKMCAAK